MAKALFRHMKHCAGLIIFCFAHIFPALASAEELSATPLLLLQADDVAAMDSGIRLRGLLDGLGIPYHHQSIDKHGQGDDPVGQASDATVPRSSWERYQTILVLPGFLRSQLQSQWLNAVLKQALREGTSVIYLGASFCANADAELQDLFAVSLDTVPCGQTAAEQQVQGFSLESWGLKARFLTLHPNELILRLSKNSAKAEQSWLLFRPRRDRVGEAILVGFDILSYWKHPASSSSYLRPLLLTRLLNRSLSKGYVAKHASPHGMQAPLLLRWEDVMPLASKHSDQQLLDRLHHFEQVLARQRLPVNIAVISHYVHPGQQIRIGWSGPGAVTLRLKEFVHNQLRLGGALIVHGYSHQHGSGADDYSAYDGEMWDEDANVYLSKAEQFQKVIAARRQARADWGVEPLAWETPHYQANAATYAAVADAGFKYVVESDSSVFPNRHGFANQLDPRLLIIPETGFSLPLSADQLEQKLTLWGSYIQPDLYEIGAPFLFFYHGYSQQQLQALERLLQASSRYQYWQPNLIEYARFWQQRQDFRYELVPGAKAATIRMRISGGFKGATLRIRLPDGCKPDQVVIDSVRQHVVARQYDQIWYVYLALPSQRSRSIEVMYRKMP